MDTTILDKALILKGYNYMVYCIKAPRKGNMTRFLTKAYEKPRRVTRLFVDTGQRRDPVAYIYGLIDPTTHLVMYVGMTRDVSRRYREHCRGKGKDTGAWVQSLTVPPALVILETAYVYDAVPARAACACETKWIKRHLRTVLNKKLRENGPKAWDQLVNR